MLKKALFMTTFAIAAQIASAAPSGQVHAVAIVDIMPTHAATGARLLTAFAGKLRHAPGVVSVALIQQAGSDNHFMIDAQYENEAAYQRVSESADVLAFRRDVFPHLGGPWDERAGHDIAL